MLCSNCGADNPRDVHFCKNCGTPLPQSEQEFAELLANGKITKAIDKIELFTKIKSYVLNFIVRFWRGGYSLWLSYWVIGLLTLLVNIMLTKAFEAIADSQEIRPITHGILILTYYAIIYSIILWSNIGAWRSASNHAKNNGKKLWPILAKITIIVGLIGAAGDLSKINIYILKEAVKLIFGVEGISPYQLVLIENGTELELRGGMPFGTAKAIKDFLEKSPSIQVVRLNSKGGNINEAYRIFELIKGKKLITYTSADCESACAIAYLAGRERYLGENGRLGFHSASIGELNGLAYHEINERILKTLQSYNVPESFIDHALYTPPNDMWYPSKEQLLEVRLVDKIVDSRFGALFSIIEWKKADKVESDLLKNSVYSALAQHDAQGFTKLREIIAFDIRNNKEETEIKNDANLLMKKLTPAYLGRATDESLRHFWQSKIKNIKYLAKNSPKNCAGYLFPQFADSTGDPQQLLPQDMQDADKNVLTEVIKSPETDQHGNKTNPKVKIDLQTIMSKLRQKYPWAIEVVRNPDGYKNNPSELCVGFVALYTEILNIPSIEQSGEILRYLSGSGNEIDVVNPPLIKPDSSLK